MLLEACICDNTPYVVTICGRGFEAKQQLGRIHLHLELAKVEHDFNVTHENGQSIDQDISRLTIDFDIICRALDPNVIAYLRGRVRT